MIYSTKQLFLSALFLCNMHMLVAIKAPIKTNVYSLGNILKKNDKKPFTIVKALYGSKGSGQTIDVKSLLAEHAKKGVLFIPQDMDSVFKGVAGVGQKKELDVVFSTADDIVYQLTVDDAWQIPSWYNFTLAEGAQTLLTRVPYRKAEKCSLEDLLLLLEKNNKKPFTIVSGQYGRLQTQKIVDITSKLNPYARSGIFLLPEDAVEFCQTDPAPQVEKKLQIVFEIDNQWYQVQVPEKWSLPVHRGVDVQFDGEEDLLGFNSLLITRSPKRDMIFLKLPFQPANIKKLEQALCGNAGKPFTIQEAFVTQPMFPYTHYDVTTTVQVHASMGKLCLPQNLREFIGNQGVLPYMYVMKIKFVMGIWTNIITFRDGFWDFTLDKHAETFCDMKTTCSSYVCLHY